MEIGPVGTVRLAPRVRARGEGLAPPAALEVEATVLTGEETYTPSVLRAAAGAEEDDGAAFENQADEESGPPANGGWRNRVNYFV